MEKVVDNSYFLWITCPPLSVAKITFSFRTAGTLTEIRTFAKQKRTDL